MGTEIEQLRVGNPDLTTERHYEFLAILSSSTVHGSISFWPIRRQE
jgi:hypothetical protein